MNKKNNIYGFSVERITGEFVSLEEFMGKIVLVVNTASSCTLTRQYEALENLYEKYKDKDFVILGFPCNQFAGQESGDNSEIKQFCDLRFNITFPLFSKIDVNGKNAHPLYKFLNTALPGFLIGKRILWNFTKFLVDKNGVPIKRYGPIAKAETIEKDIIDLF
ncbi:MAG: glutathione peroxidase [Verrucomicrobiota bacterium]|nr:glutathione peroxidase [Verrucomicrobiota bacterium]